jgi:di/tricarboxylate transporter
MGWLPLFGLLHAAFFVMHYMFASQTAHVGALYSAFCAMMLASGVPPILAAMSLAYSINLFGSITHYASGQVRGPQTQCRKQERSRQGRAGGGRDGTVGQGGIGEQPAAPAVLTACVCPVRPVLAQAAVFYGSGFMRLNEVFSMGAVCGFLGLAIWAVFGMPIWKLLGWW